MNIKTLAIATVAAVVLMVGTVPSASAVVVDFGLRDVTSTGTDSFGHFQSHALGEPQPFTDDYLFSVNDIASVTFELQVNNSQGRLIDVVTGSPTVLTAELRANGAPIGSGIFATQDAPNATTFTLAFANLQDGVNYSLQVIGTVLAEAGGTYTFSGNLSQVPLPAAFWLLLTAVAGLVSVVKIRRKAAQTA
jgi:hypothetical protein